METRDNLNGRTAAWLPVLPMTSETQIVGYPFNVHIPQFLGSIYIYPLNYSSIPVSCITINIVSSFVKGLLLHARLEKS